jgi:hypothetical protein
MAASKVLSWLWLLPLLMAAATGLLTPTAMAAAALAFDENYMVQWGADGRHLVDRGTEVDLAMDQNSGTYVCVHCAACKKCAQQRDFFFWGLVK